VWLPLLLPLLSEKPQASHKITYHQVCIVLYSDIMLTTQSYLSDEKIVFAMKLIISSTLLSKVVGIAGF
jgi:hypothetical protein